MRQRATATTELASGYDCRMSLLTCAQEAETDQMSRGAYCMGAGACRARVARRGVCVTETPPVSLRLPPGSRRIPQTGTSDGARLDACSSHQRVCVFRYTWLLLPVTVWVGVRPLQDIVLLRDFCARINPHFIAPSNLYCPHYCYNIARLLRNIRRPPRPPLCMPYTIQYWY